jgi:hypothetical protein
MLLNEQATQLLNRQLTHWPLAAKNYRALAHVETKQLQISGYTFTVQFNPARITSSSAKVDAQTIQERACFLCRHHLPPEQEVLPYTAQSGNEYLILCNPFPIFPRHLTIPDCKHTDQLIFGRIEDMVELAEQLSDFVLLYNGPKCGASAPDHFHFQAGNKGFLPLQAAVESGASIEHYPVSAFVVQSEEANGVAAALKTAIPLEPEPMFNLLCWKTGSKFYLVVFPRKCHRPAQYFAEGDAHILLSPGSIDLGGVVITPLEKDFRRLSEADVANIFAQISLSSFSNTLIINSS